MSPQIITALIGVFAALGGTAIGSIAAYYANKNLKRKEWELTLIKEELNERQTLYSEFLSEGYKLALMSTSKNSEEIGNIVISSDIIHRSVSKIELISNKEVISAAKGIVSHLFDASSGGKKNKDSFSELKDFFIKEAKSELESLKRFQY